MASLGSIVTWQKLEYDFDFHKQSFPTDIVALVLSEGKSIIKAGSSRWAFWFIVLFMAVQIGQGVLSF